MYIETSTSLILITDLQMRSVMDSPFAVLVDGDKDIYYSDDINEIDYIYNKIKDYIYKGINIVRLQALIDEWQLEKDTVFKKY